MVLVSLFASIAFGLVGDPVPAPRETPVEVVVRGRTSSIKSITIKNVGSNIPLTYAKDHLKNAPGFAWFVSKHYALQTDYQESRAKELLTYLELAYPHYVELFGKEPSNIASTRMAVVYGSSKEKLRTKLEADGIAWDFGGGGITYEGLNIAYNYPSGSLQYHQRYILIHECTHLFQDCLNGTPNTTPSWYYEGIADALAHHVLEEGENRITFNVVDKPTINNWYDAGLSIYASQPFKASDILSGKRGGRELGFLLVHYFDTDLDRLLRFRIWRDELFRLNLYGKHQADSDRLIEELFGLSKLDSNFEAWIKARRSSFRYVDWGWEQDGDTLVSYGWPQTGAYSQTDLLFLPKDKAAYDPLIMDYPLHPQSPLVEPVSRGSKEPSVGCLVGFKFNPDSGVAGIALGVDGRSFVKVLVEQRRRLTLDSTDLGGMRQTVDFPPAFVEACSKTFQIGLSIKIAQDALLVTAKAGESPIQTCRGALPLNVDLRKRLMAKPMAVLSRDGRHEIAPYVDDARQMEQSNAPLGVPNRWRCLYLPELYRLYRAAWRLGISVPQSLTTVRQQMLLSASHNRAKQEAVLLAYRKQWSQIVKDVKRSKAKQETISLALRELGSSPP